MRIGELLVAQGLISDEQVEAARQRQLAEGGRLGDNLVAVGAISAEALDRFFQEAPAEPMSVAETGLRDTKITELLLKTMLLQKLETANQCVEALKLPFTVINIILERAVEQRLLEILGSTGSSASSQFRYALTGAGNQYASDALERNQYIGPAPVSISAFCYRVLRQKISNAHIPQEKITNAYNDLIVPDALLSELGPAINSGKSMLLYGAPGNGKSSLAERMNKMFEDIIYIPHAVDIDGEIIKIFDPSLHFPIKVEEKPNNSILKDTSIEKETLDKRWIAVRRPLIIVGGELTLEMLDLQYNNTSGFYEAPLHMKALNGIMMIDDFGRQLVAPDHLLNRWIIPLERRVDYLKLHTGRTFEIPFDALVIFSTNLTPEDLMDPAFLRRIPYKIEIESPAASDFQRIFKAVANANGLEFPDGAIEYVGQMIQSNGMPLAAYQPKFVIEQVLSACKYESRPPTVERSLIDRALKNLSTKKMHATADAPQGM
ncbi:hypothetical protein [Limibacillus sp. MBR-115]|jgi:energy-coupling factor transporter ATP-binding protein EcfA2|uniref:hypothetical protein n=1 Tax=Limibacillus sp. MBR-115 TaxID=3156465 RepID=UPI0033912B4B